MKKKLTCRFTSNCWGKISEEARLEARNVPVLKVFPPFYRVYGRTSSVNTVSSRLLLLTLRNARPHTHATRQQKVLWALEECELPFELVHASKWLGPTQNQYKGGELLNPRPLVDTDALYVSSVTRDIITSATHASITLPEQRRDESVQINPSSGKSRGEERGLATFKSL